MDIAKDGKVEVDRFLKIIGADRLLTHVLSEAQHPAEVPYQFAIRKGNDKFSLNLQGVFLPKVWKVFDIVEGLEKSADMDKCWLTSVKLILKGVCRKIKSPYWSVKKGDFVNERVKNWYAKECTFFL